MNEKDILNAVAKELSNEYFLTGKELEKRLNISYKRISFLIRKENQKAYPDFNIVSILGLGYFNLDNFFKINEEQKNEVLSFLEARKKRIDNDYKKYGDLMNYLYKKVDFYKRENL